MRQKFAFFFLPTFWYQRLGVVLYTIEDTYFLGAYSKTILPNVDRNVYHSTKTSQDRADVSTLIYIRLVRTYFNVLVGTVVL